ncbi:MAG: NAD(P)/FAD-dependent oxidoreductase [Herpetosiphonaceae bacterium]|nr:NAD(P)/FAD-dependent oxidoreductase [Herpetosiphonaceae bacterium]
MHIPPATQRRVVIIGAGFGGQEVAKHLAGAPVDILLLDRNNYYGFWPLLYQVATAGLEPQEIALPTRALLRGIPNIQFRVAQVERVDFDRRVVATDQGDFPYDEVVISAGTATNFFGLPEIEAQSFDLKDVPAAVALRNHLITCFERAVGTDDVAERQRLLCFVVVGGGPTGVELAGAITELTRHVMPKDYPALDFAQVQIHLLEATNRLLAAFPDRLGRKAQRTLTSMGVNVQLGVSVTGYQDSCLRFEDGNQLSTATVIWAAGVKAAALATTLPVTRQRGDRIPVTPELQLADRPEVWVLGDMAYLEGPDGKPYPQLATVAMQQGRLVARNLVRKLRGKPLEPFHYFDKGMMATIGRRRAVARIWNMNWSGTIAWWLWLGVHILYLAGFRNRVLVLINWAYSYLTYDRGARAVFATTQRADDTL